MRHVVFALLPLFLAVGCSVSRQTVVKAATGAGHVIGLRNFTFAALENGLSFIGLVAGVALLLTLQPDAAFAQPPGTATVDFPGALHTQLTGINAAGEITGTYINPDSSVHGFVLDREGFTTIDVPGSFATRAQGLNTVGDIVGIYQPGPQAFLLRDGSFYPIAYPGAVTTTAGGINERGEIVGNYRAQGLIHGYVVRKGDFHSFDVPGSTLTVASAVNASGDIVGRYQTAPGPFYRMFRLSNGVFTSIDFPGALSTGSAGTMAGISEAGEIVGNYRASDNKVRGFLLNADGYTTIDFPDTIQVQAAGINAQGDIVGYFVDLGGRAHGFLIRHGG